MMTPTLEPLKDVVVLVVEDDAETRAFLAAALEGAGAAVATAGSAAEAMERLRRDVPHCIVTDLHLGADTGFKLLGAVRGAPDQRIGRLPVIAITGREEYRRAVTEVPFHKVFFKPFDPDDLVAAIRGSLAA